jgi:hypothetical protein
MGVCGAPKIPAIIPAAETATWIPTAWCKDKSLDIFGPDVCLDISACKLESNLRAIKPKRKRKLFMLR